MEASQEGGVNTPDSSVELFDSILGHFLRSLASTGGRSCWVRKSMGDCVVAGRITHFPKGPSPRTPEDGTARADPPEAQKGARNGQKAERSAAGASCASQRRDPERLPIWASW